MRHLGDGMTEFDIVLKCGCKNTINAKHGLNENIISKPVFDNLKPAVGGKLDTICPVCRKNFEVTEFKGEVIK